MTAYLDLIILENFCMNFLILFTTAKLLRRAVKKRRIILASIIGDLYTFSLWFKVPPLLLNISKILMAVVLLKICFNAKKTKQLLREVVVFFIVSFIYAGCTLGFIYFTKPKVIYIVNGIIIGGEYIFELVLISALISFILIKLSMKVLKLKQKISKENMICSLKIINNKKQVCIKALLDTGNLLADPISHSPVIVCEYQEVKQIIPPVFIDEIEYLMGGEKCIKLNKCSHNTKIRAIPYTSVGNTNGILIAYKVERIEVEYSDEIYVLNDVLIGFYKKSFTKNKKYSALIGLKILEGGNTKHELNSNIKNEGKYSVC